MKFLAICAMVSSFFASLMLSAVDEDGAFPRRTAARHTEASARADFELMRLLLDAGLTHHATGVAVPRVSEMTDEQMSAAVGAMNAIAGAVSGSEELEGAVREVERWARAFGVEREGSAVLSRASDE